MVAPAKHWHCSGTPSDSSGPAPNPLITCTVRGRSCWRTSPCKPPSASLRTPTARRRRRKAGGRKGRRRRRGSRRRSLCYGRRQAAIGGQLGPASQ